MTSRILVLLLLCASPAAAEPLGVPVRSDLNSDGRAEIFTLLDTGDGTADLQIENTGWGNGVIYAEDIAWVGGIGQRPELDLAPNGSVQLISMNESIGRDRWELTLTIAYRADAYRVAGFTYRWRDTIENDNNGVCDLNLLTGRGLLSHNGGPERPIRTALPALPITAWKDDIGPPPACGLPN